MELFWICTGISEITIWPKLLTGTITLATYACSYTMESFTTLYGHQLHSKLAGTQIKPNGVKFGPLNFAINIFLT